MALWPRRTEFVLSKDAMEDVDLLVKHADGLVPIVQKAKEHDFAFRVSDVIDQLTDRIGLPSTEVSRIFNALENLKILSQEFGGADAALGRLLRAVAPDLKERLRAASAAILEAMRAYDDNNPVAVSFKAQRLTFLREKLFHDAEIITDVRPVFDGDGEKVLEMIITHSLVMTYWTNNRFETAHVSMDAADVLKLRTAADRAMLKARTLRDSLKSKWKTEVLRDEDDTA